MARPRFLVRAVRAVRLLAADGRIPTLRDAWRCAGEGETWAGAGDATSPDACPSSRPGPALRRASILLALLGLLAWCLLLFGIGLDDLTSGDTRPGVIFSIVALSLSLAAVIGAIWRLVGARLTRTLSRR